MDDEPPALPHVVTFEVNEIGNKELFIIIIALYSDQH